MRCCFMLASILRLALAKSEHTDVSFMQADWLFLHLSDAPLVASLTRYALWAANFA